MNWKCTGIFLTGQGHEFTQADYDSWDVPTQRECDISGLCDRCQDVVFAEPDEPAWVPEEELLWDDRFN